MKKTIFACAAVWTLLSAALPAAAQSAAQSAAQNAVVAELSGTVELKRAGSSTFVPARAGDTLARSTVISTGFKSSAVINLGNSRLIVRPLTRLTLEELTSEQGNERVSLELRSGRVRAEVAPPVGGRTDFTVRSPSATASVRGTVFDFDTAALSVSEGAVAFSGADGRIVLVEAGDSSRVDERTGAAEDSLVSSAAELLPPLPAGTGTGSVLKPAGTALTDPLPQPDGDLTVDFAVNFGW
jgi:hypothetical protein